MMFAMPPPPPSHLRKSLPQRTDSLVANKTAQFTQIEEELRDVRRVHSQGQEEDLRMALSRTISRVEELTAMLKEAFKVQTDLQTELTLAKSNLQLALANNEMLEDALKRDGPGHSKDVGWRRMSAREQRERELAADSRRQSMESIASAEAPSPVVPASPAVPPASASTSEGRFFKFRFGSTSGVGSPRLPGNVSPNPALQAAHLTSASLPSLVPSRDKDKELEDMLALLDQERKAHKAAQAAKEALENELESLSQALFEEANKMVAAERMKLAEAEAELREAQAEKDALRSALKLVEGQRLDTESAANSPALPTAPTHAHKRSSSSAIAIKSLPSSAPSSPRSMLRVAAEHIEQATARAPVPPPLDLPEVGLAHPGVETSPADDKGEEKADEDVIEGEAEEDGDETKVEENEEHTGDTPATARDESKLLSAPSVAVTSATPSPSPTPSPGQFGYSSSRPVAYFDVEESPWADVRSTSPLPTATTI